MALSEFYGDLMQDSGDFLNIIIMAIYIMVL